MKSKSSSWEDLVFEKRNKAYGAYAIRQSYSTHVTEAIAGSMILVALVLLYPMISTLWGGEKVIFNMPTIRELTNKVDVVPTIERSVKTVKQQKATVKKAAKFTVTTERTPDPDVVFDPPTSTHVPGTEEGHSAPVEGNVGTAELPIIPASTGPLLIAQFMPSYEGGMQAMSQFISRHMKYPHRRDLEGKVYVEFVVDELGYVVDVKVVRGIGPEYDKEAARVVGAMPHWRPGRQGDNPVAVRMVLPINFVLER